MKLTLKILRYLAIYFVAMVLLLFAVTKFLDTQFQVWKYMEYIPLKDLPLFWQAWAFFGKSYPYGVFLGVAELCAGLLLLFDRTRLAGLLLSLGIFLNVVIIDFEFQVWQALTHAVLELILVLLLLTGYLKDLKKFFWDMGGRFDGAVKAPSKWSLIIPAVFALVVIGGASFVLMKATSDGDEIMGAYEITHFSIGNDTIPPTRGKYTDKPMIFFEFGNTCVFSSDGNSYLGNYAITGDSIKIRMPGGVHDIYSFAGKIDRQQNIITGLSDHKPVVLKMEQVQDNSL